MGFTLVYGGEHYVVDELAGVAYALVVIAGWRYLRRPGASADSGTQAQAGYDASAAKVGRSG